MKGGCILEATEIWQTFATFVRRLIPINISDCLLGYTQCCYSNIISNTEIQFYHAAYAVRFELTRSRMAMSLFLRSADAFMNHPRIENAVVLIGGEYF